MGQATNEDMAVFGEFRDQYVVPEIDKFARFRMCFGRRHVMSPIMIGHPFYGRTIPHRLIARSIELGRTGTTEPPACTRYGE